VVKVGDVEKQTTVGIGEFPWAVQATDTFTCQLQHNIEAAVPLCTWLVLSVSSRGLQGTELLVQMTSFELASCPSNLQHTPCACTHN
jgi:hypothetical protein